MQSRRKGQGKGKLYVGIFDRRFNYKNSFFLTNFVKGAVTRAVNRCKRDTVYKLNVLPEQKKTGFVVCMCNRCEQSRILLEVRFLGADQKDRGLLEEGICLALGSPACASNTTEHSN